jgi:hypothetical protein
MNPPESPDAEVSMTRRVAVDLAQERRALFKRAALAIATCVVVLGLTSLLLPRIVAFPESSEAVWVFWARLQLVPWLWVAYAMGAVSRARRQSAQDVMGSAYGTPSETVAVRRAFLQNTLEQAALWTIASLVLTTWLRGPALAVLVGAAVLFCVGRWSFLRRYPDGAAARGFGFVLTALPTLVGFAVALVWLARDLWHTF